MNDTYSSAIINVCESLPCEHELNLHKKHTFQALLRDACTVTLNKKIFFFPLCTNSDFCCFSCILTAANIKCHVVFLLMNLKGIIQSVFFSFQG